MKPNRDAAGLLTELRKIAKYRSGVAGFHGRWKGIDHNATRAARRTRRAAQQAEGWVRWVGAVLREART